MGGQWKFIPVKEIFMLHEFPFYFFDDPTIVIFLWECLVELNEMKGWNYALFKLESDPEKSTTSSLSDNGLT